MQFLIRERMRGMAAPNTIKSRGALLLELARELRDLRDELEERRYGKYDQVIYQKKEIKNTLLEKEAPEPTKREISQATLPPAEVPKHQQRPSLISLFTGVGVPQPTSHTSSSIQIDSRSGTLIGTPSDTLSQQVMHHPPRGESLSSSSTTTNKEPSDSHSGECPTPNQSAQSVGSSTIIGGNSNTSSTTGTTVHHGSSYLAHSMSLQQQGWKVQTPRLRFVSSVEFRHSSGETSTTPLSPESPIDDSSGEAQRPSRLQRSKAQSRKTFRIRRGRQTHGEVSIFY